MCGICGVVQIGGVPRRVVAPDVLDRMTDAMTHRGPNDRGVLQVDGVALGVRRLSIVDVEGGHQPVASEDGGVWAIQNGELYNHADVREELVADGHVFRSRCDTEVLPHLYERYGAGFAERLRGKFGIAVWDRRHRRAVLARDRLGVKPLYWARVDDLVVFASELKSLLASELVGTELDYEAIDSYLTLGFFPGPRTPLANVAKLMPGHRLVIDADGVREESYWRFPEPDPQPGSVDEHAAGLLEVLEEATVARLMSDVPLGAMLSGGIDSSVIVALMARNTSEPVQTFSVGFAEDGDLNELSDARLVADTFGTEHHELTLSRAEATIDLEELVWFVDEPLADLSSLGFLALSELAAKHVTVALAGQGADELLGGYVKHRAASLSGKWNRLPSPVRRVGVAAAMRGPARARRAARTLAAPDPTTRLLAMSGKLNGHRTRLYKGPLAELDGGAASRAVESRLNGLQDGPLESTLYVDAQLALVDDMLHYFDRASMARSLEVRVPFLDHNVVEYCARIPASLKVRGLQTKHVLKHAARGLIPDRIIDKRKVGFFAESIGGWFTAHADDMVAEYLLGPAPRYAEFLEPSEVRRLVDAHVSGADTANANLLLAILMLEVWLQTYLPRAVPSTHSAGRVLVPA